MAEDGGQGRAVAARIYLRDSFVCRYCGAIADVATALSLSEGTVRNHLSAVIQKLSARNRADAARIAREKGWL